MDKKKKYRKLKKARWSRHAHLFRFDEYECSECGYIALNDYTVCPRCNSLMRWKEYDPAWIDEIETASTIFDDD